MNNATNEKDMLKDQVQGIIEILENPPELEADEKIDAGYDADEYACLSAMDYLKDALDIEYTVNSQGEYLGARILAAFGGPNIWIETRHSRVEANWWNDSYSAGFNDDAMCLDEACRELFECM